MDMDQETQFVVHYGNIRWDIKSSSLLVSYAIPECFQSDIGHKKVDSRVSLIGSLTGSSLGKKWWMSHEPLFHSCAFVVNTSIVACLLDSRFRTDNKLIVTKSQVIMSNHNNNQLTGEEKSCELIVPFLISQFHVDFFENMIERIIRGVLEGKRLHMKMISFEEMADDINPNVKLHSLFVRNMWKVLNHIPDSVLTDPRNESTVQLYKGYFNLYDYKMFIAQMPTKYFWKNSFLMLTKAQRMRRYRARVLCEANLFDMQERLPRDCCLIEKVALVQYIDIGLFGILSWSEMLCMDTKVCIPTMLRRIPSIATNINYLHTQYKSTAAKQFIQNVSDKKYTVNLMRRSFGDASEVGYVIIEGVDETGYIGEINKIFTKYYVNGSEVWEGHITTIS